METDEADTMRDHDDFDYDKAIRGRTAARLAKMGYPVMVMLRPEVAEVFKDEASVNEALLKAIEMGKFAQMSHAKKRFKRGMAANKKPQVPVNQNG